MKKCKLIRISSLFLAVIMLCLSLAGCGKSDPSSDPQKDPSNGSTSSEYVYVPEYTSLPSVKGEIGNVFISGDRIYFSTTEYTWDNEFPEDPIVYAEPEIAVAAVDTVAVEAPIVIAPAPVPAPAETSEPQPGTTEAEPFDPEKYLEDYYDDESYYTVHLFSADLSGSNLSELSGYALSSIPDGTHGNVNFDRMVCDASGNLWVFESAYTYHYELPDDFDPVNDYPWNYYVDDGQIYYLRKLDSNGAEVACADISELAARVTEQNGWFYINSFAFDSADNLYILCDTNVFVLDSTGKMICEIDSDYYLSNSVTLADGKVYIMSYMDDGQRLLPVDLSTSSFGNAIEMPYAAYDVYPGNSEYDIFFNKSSTSFYGYDFETKTETKLLNWIDCDINCDEVRNTTVRDDGQIICFSTTWSENGTKSELIKLNKTPASEVPQKTVLTLACMYLDYDLRNRIIEFNKKSSDLRISVNDYSEFNTEENYTAGLTKLSAEIIAGDIPDLLFTESLPIKQYIAKGLLEDLYPYIDNDPELHREDLVPGFLNSLEVNGGLYQASANFRVQTVVGRGSVVGEEPGWTIRELMNIMAETPDDMDCFDIYTTRDTILEQACMFCMDDFIDWDTGKCSFDNDDFVALLEFANSFPAEFDWENYDYEADYESEIKRVRTGKQLLCMCYAYDFDTFQQYDAIYEGDASYKGFPTYSGSGSVIAVDSGLAMSSKCKDKQGAWEFIRVLFTEDYQTENVWWMFPSNQNAFDARLKDAMTPYYYTDENGEEVESPKSSIGWGDDDFMVEIYALKQDEADRIVDFINSIDRLYSYDENIMNIIKEQSLPFFNGQKSAKDTAALIQSRVNIIVNEQR